MATDRDRFLRSNGTNTAGGNGTTDSDSGANRAYLTFAEMESAEESGGANLVSLDQRLHVIARGGVENTGGGTINGFTTDRTAGQYILIEGDGTYQITRSDDRAIGLADDDVTLYNLIIRAQGNQFGISDLGVGSGGEIYVERCNVYNSDAEPKTGRGIAMVDGTWRVGWNTVRGFYHTASVGYGIACTGATAYVYSNTVDRCRFGFVRLSGAMTIRNNIGSDCQNACYNGSWAASSGNGSTDTSSPETGKRSQSYTYVAAASWNLHLDPGSTNGIGDGSDLSADGSYPQGEDFDGLAYASWDGVNTGADQFAGGGGPTGNPWHYYAQAR